MLEISKLAIEKSNFKSLQEFKKLKKDYENKEKKYKDYDTWLTDEQEADIAESIIDMFDND